MFYSRNVKKKRRQKAKEKKKNKKREEKNKRKRKQILHEIYFIYFQGLGIFVVVLYLLDI